MTEDIERAKNAVAACRRGERVQSVCSLHAKEDAERSAKCDHRWRTIICYQSEEDVVECQDCGKQDVAKCDFDEEFD